MTRPSAILVIASGALLGACTYEKVVGVRGGLYGLPGAEGGLKVEGEPDDSARKSSSGNWDAILTEFRSDDPDAQAGAVGEEEAYTLRRTRPDGSIDLISRSPNHVMFHVTQTLATGERDLLIEQVMSERLKRSYEARGLDPIQGAEFLIKHQQHIGALFASMPLGEQTPGVFLETIGRNMFRLRAPAQLAPDLRFNYFDVIVEGGEFRLLMIGREAPSRG